MSLLLKKNKILIDKKVRKDYTGDLKDKSLHKGS